MTFKSALIFTHPRLHHDILKPALEETLQTLQDNAVEALLEIDSANYLNMSKVKTHSMDESCAGIDLFIAIGGDGTLLQAGRKAAEENIPVVGINRGNLGFLTDIKPDEIQTKLKQILHGEFNEESRFLLEAKLAGTNESLGIGLNDIVFYAGDHMHMIELDLYLDDKPFFNLKGDGLLISTPTGSTAYSLSAGGPILHPNLNAISIIPMYPHTLSNRPVVLDGTSKITIHVGPNNSKRPRLSADGQHRNRLNKDTVVEVQQYSKKLRLLHPVDYNYFETLRSKLHWQIKST